jgi:hypothetical protein
MPIELREQPFDRDMTTRTAAVRAETLDEEGRSVEAVLTTEATTEVFDWRSWTIIDEVLRMDGMEAPSQVPMLAVHSRSSIDDVLGSVRSMRVEDGKIVGRLHFAEGDEASDKAWNKVRQGHLTDVSIGYRVLDAVEIPAGKSANVVGKRYEAKEKQLRIATRWKLKEGSLVPIGADEFAKIREQAVMAARTETSPMNERLRKFLESKGLRTDATAEEAWRFYAELTEDARQEADKLKTQAKAPEAEPKQERGDAGTTPPQPQEHERQVASASQEPPAQQDTESVLRQERARVAEIRELGLGAGVNADLVARAESEGWTIERASAEFLRSIQEQRTEAVDGDSPRVSVGTTGDDRLRSDMTRSLAWCYGNVAIASEAERNAAERFSGIGFHDMARVVFRTNGYESPDALFNRAISQSIFAQILGDSATRILMKEYDEAESTIQTWAGVTEVKDFREYKTIRLGEFGSIEEIGKGGEIHHGTLQEAYEVEQAKTYGRRFALTRKDWIGDDLGAFMRIPGMLGRVAKRNISDVGYALLVSNSGVGPTMNEDSTALFSASHTSNGETKSNYSTGAVNSALSKTGLRNAKKLMRKQIGMAGEKLNLKPKWLLVPSDLEEPALEYTTSPSLAVGGGAWTDTATIQPAKNIHAGTLTPIVETRLDDATNGTTAWYIACDQAVQESVVIVYLRGNRNPVVERKDPVDVLGIGWWMYHDVGVAVRDWRGIVRSKGAAA